MAGRKPGRGTYPLGVVVVLDVLLGPSRALVSLCLAPLRLIRQVRGSRKSNRWVSLSAGAPTLALRAPPLGRTYQEFLLADVLRPRELFEDLAAALALAVLVLARSLHLLALRLRRGASRLVRGSLLLQRLALKKKWGPSESRVVS